MTVAPGAIRGAATGHDAAFDSAVPAGPGEDAVRGGKPSLRRALESARQHLLSLQNGLEGYWYRELEANTTLTSEWVFLCHMLGRRDLMREQKCVAELLAEQLPDGGWGIGDGKGAEVSTSIEAYVALRLCGVAADTSGLVRARRRILQLGGMGRARAFTRIYFALMGLVSYEQVPILPAWLMVQPRWSPLNIYEMSSWARSCVVPLMVLLDRRPVWRPEARIDLAELQAESPASAGAAAPFESLATRAFGGADSVLRALQARGWVPFRERSLRLAERYVVERQESEGDWGGIYPAMAFSILALRALGYHDDHPAIRKGLQALERFGIESEARYRMQSCVSPVWDTALAMWALQDAGLPSTDRRLARAAEWLLEKQIVRYGDWVEKNPKARPGGWSFEFYNQFFPDCDDTAAVILGLQPVRLGPVDAYRDATVQRALDWLLSMQCRAGGWAAFDVNNDQPLWNEIPFADHRSMLDPCSPDVTGRVLEMLGKQRGRSHAQAVARAVAYLRREQRADGSWFGRWGVNYVYGTWAVLAGLVAVGVPSSDEMIRRGSAFLRQAQNADGGWGESCASYEQSQFVRAASTASQTAWGTMGVLAAEGGASEAAGRGAEWLVSHQNDDGSWSEVAFTGTGFPRHFYIRYHIYRDCFPTMALGRYCAAQNAAATGRRSAGSSYHGRSH